MPLILIVFASTGASPVMAIRLLLVVIVEGTGILKAAASSAAMKVRMALRWPEMKLFTSDGGPGETGVTPLARKARYLASNTGSILAANMGPVASSLRPRK